MLRGVKKQIIEVTNTENEYFEKAILVVSDRYMECDRAKLSRKATEYVCSINPFEYSERKSSKKLSPKAIKLLGLFKYVFASGAGAAILYFAIR